MKPELYKFLEGIIRQLTSRAGRGWQQQFKASKHLGTTILIKVQMVVANLVQAASQTNIQNKAFDTVIAHDCFTNLAKAMQLLEYFNTDLDRAITGNELSTFQAIPPLYTTLLEASTGKNATRIAIVRTTVTAAETMTATKTKLGTKTKARAEITRRAGAVIPHATHPVTTTTNQGK